MSTKLERLDIWKRKQEDPSVDSKNGNSTNKMEYTRMMEQSIGTKMKQVQYNKSQLDWI